MPVGIVESPNGVAKDVEGPDSGAGPVGHDRGVGHLGEGLVQEDAKVVCGDGRAHGEVGGGVGGVTEGECRDRVAQATAPMLVAECDEVSFVWVDAQATAGHPVHDSMEVGGNEVS